MELEMFDFELTSSSLFLLLTPYLLSSKNAKELELPHSICPTNRASSVSMEAVSRRTSSACSTDTLSLA